MDISEKKKALEAQIARLEQIRKELYDLEEEVLAIEKNVCSTDESSPDNKQIARLCDRAYALIDELLGPPDENSEVPQKTFYPDGSVKKFS